MEAKNLTFNRQSVTNSIVAGLALLLVVGASSATAQAGVVFEDGNFTMATPTGNPMGNSNDIAGSWDGTFNTDVADTKFNMTLTSATTFFGTPWFAHHIRVFDAGTWTFNANCSVEQLETGVSDCCTPYQIAAGITSDCGGPTITMTVDPGQMGAHMLFNWGPNLDIDVVNVYDLNSMFDGGGLDSRMYTQEVCGFILPPEHAFCQENPDYCAEALICTEALRNTVWMAASTDDDGDGAPSVGMVDGPFRNFNANFNLRALLSATVEVGPQTLNVNSNGIGFSADITGIEGIDGLALDLSGVEDGVVITSVGDVLVPMGDITENLANRTFDGTTLTVAFDDPDTGNRQDVIAAVAGLEDRAVVAVCVKGNVADNLGNPQRFKGCGDITLRNKGTR